MRAGRPTRASLAALALSAAALGGCSNGSDNAKLAPAKDDGTPPEIRLGAEGLSEAGRMRNGQDAVIAAHARDPESGVAEVTATANVVATCVNPTNPDVLQRREFALPPATATQERSGEAQVDSNWTVYLRVPYSELGSCPVPWRARVEVSARARNFAQPAGEGTSETLAIAADSGPELIRVGTFNTGGDGRHDAPDYSKWAATLLKRVDVAFLQEVDIEHEHARLQQGNNLAYRISEGNRVLLSRFPIVDQRIHKYDDSDGGRGAIIEATLDVRGWRLVVFNNHWPHRPGRQQGRMNALSKLLDAGQPHRSDDMIAAGDFNEEYDQPEIRGVQPLFKEVFDFFGDESLKQQPSYDQELHCSNARVDYVMLHRLTVAPRSGGRAADGLSIPYDGCGGPEGEPSDHPFVQVEVRRP